MKLYEPFTAIFVGVILISACYGIFMKVKPGVIPEDNPIEELIIEPLVEMVLDLPDGSIDITPNSPEEESSLADDARIIAEYIDEAII